MKVGVLAIVHDLVSPEKPTDACFAPYRAFLGFCLIGFTGPRNARRTPVVILLAAPATAVLGGSIPWGGTRSEVPARPAGGNGALAAQPTLSTGCLRKAAEMISISFVWVGR